MYELRWHGHAAEADVLGVKLRRRAEALPPLAGDASRAATDTRGRLELLAAMHRWPELEASRGDLLKSDPANIVGLRLRGVAFAMQGKRALALGVDSTLASATTSERLVDQCYLATIPGSCRRVGRAASST